MEWMFPNAISQIQDDLFQSNCMPCSDEGWLKRYNIQAIVNVTNDVDCKFKDKGIDYFHIPVDDCPEDSKILETYLDDATLFIDNNKKENKKCLVHCNAGISRSSTVTIAYLIKYENMSLKDAYKFLKAARPIAYPNEGFWKILENWEEQYYN